MTIGVVILSKATEIRITLMKEAERVNINYPTSRATDQLKLPKSY